MLLKLASPASIHSYMHATVTVYIFFIIFVQTNIDILHPLTTLQWEECCELPDGDVFTQCVFLHGKIYVGMTKNKYNAYIYRHEAVTPKVYASSTDFTSWNVLPVPNIQWNLR